MNGNADNGGAGGWVDAVRARCTFKPTNTEDTEDCYWLHDIRIMIYVVKCQDGIFFFFFHFFFLFKLVLKLLRSRSWLSKQEYTSPVGDRLDSLCYLTTLIRWL